MVVTSENFKSIVFQYYNITGQIKVYWKECTTQNATHWMDCDVMYVLIYHIYKCLSFAHKNTQKHDLDGSFMPI